MALTFRCACGKKLSVRDEMAGRSVRCPSCMTVLKVPAPQPEPALEVEDTYSLVEASSQSPVFSTSAGSAMSGQKLGGTEQSASPGPEIARSRGRQSAPSFAREDRRSSVREYLYLALSLALIPLLMSFLAPKAATIEDRLKATMDRAGAETITKVKALESREGVDLDDLLEVLPDGKIDATAHLPRATSVHWLYGAVAAAGFWIFTMLLFPAERRTPHHLLLVGLFTGTCGIVLLLGFQYAAAATQGVWLRGRGIITLIFYIVKFIGWSYASADDPDSNLLLSFIGFTCGVGLCEELCKALPLLWHYQREPKLGWRGAATLGSGLGGRLRPCGRDHVLVSLL